MRAITDARDTQACFQAAAKSNRGVETRQSPVNLMPFAVDEIVRSNSEGLIRR
jgi:hypothetical protein